MDLVCFIILIMFPFAAVFADYQRDQVDFLIAFKTGLFDPDNLTQSWDPTLVNPCTWFHVTCDPDNNVIRVDLGNTGGNITGPLVPDLGRLTTLQYLGLYGNKINGSIPVELGNLVNLVTLDLYNNSLTGSIPQGLSNLQNLTWLRLNDNKLSGPIPALTNLPSLVVMDLHDNEITEEIPAGLGDLTNLGTLDLSNNKLTGSIPSQLSNLNHLQSLRLNENNLSGRVPFPSDLKDLFPFITTWDFAGNLGLCGDHTNNPDCS